MAAPRSNSEQSALIRPLPDLPMTLRVCRASSYSIRSRLKQLPIKRAHPTYWLCKPRRLPFSLNGNMTIVMMMKTRDVLEGVLQGVLKPARHAILPALLAATAAALPACKPADADMQD